MQDWEEQAVLVTVTLTQHNLHPTFHSTATVVTLSFLKSSSTKKYPINPCTLLTFQIKLELSHLSSNNQHSSVGVANILHVRWLAHGWARSSDETAQVIAQFMLMPAFCKGIKSESFLKKSLIQRLRNTFVSKE